MALAMCRAWGFVFVVGAASSGDGLAETIKLQQIREANTALKQKLFDMESRMEGLLQLASGLDAEDDTESIQSVEMPRIMSEREVSPSYRSIREDDDLRVLRQLLELQVERLRPLLVPELDEKHGMESLTTTEASRPLSQPEANPPYGSVRPNDDINIFRDVFGSNNTASGSVECNRTHIHDFEWSYFWLPDLVLSLAAIVAAGTLALRKRGVNTPMSTSDRAACAYVEPAASVRQASLRKATPQDGDMDWAPPRKNSRPIRVSEQRQHGHQSLQDRPDETSVQEQRRVCSVGDSLGSNHLLETVTRLNSTCNFDGRPQDHRQPNTSSFLRPGWT
eukprot:TRINITY_DN50628_c0_g1_i1.p1 TRINITY_DN50628_c0_g1~~TRINITY_DN50628_c0_g1_i1.p1  ORF type:complete len:360 (-),score=21.81 TRINITY_DN50628_c0_g1_i1:67-1071(-)